MYLTPPSSYPTIQSMNIILTVSGPTVHSFRREWPCINVSIRQIQKVFLLSHGHSLARRTGQSAASACHRQTTDGIISNVFQGKTRISKSGRAISFPDENEKIAHSNSGQRSVRTLPFSKETFREISKRLFIHGSISRVVSRADVPVFMRAEVDMEDFSYDLPATAEVCPHLMHTAFSALALLGYLWHYEY